jgi:hypothetical protein
VFTYPSDLLLRGDLEGAAAKEIKPVSLDQPIGAGLPLNAAPGGASLNQNQSQVEHK